MSERAEPKCAVCNHCRSRHDIERPHPCYDCACEGFAYVKAEPAPPAPPAAPAAAPLDYEPRFECRHCGERIYWDTTNRPHPAWRHHGSNYVLCFGGKTTEAEPAPPAPPAAPEYEDALKAERDRLQAVLINLINRIRKLPKRFPTKLEWPEVKDAEAALSEKGSK